MKPWAKQLLKSNERRRRIKEAGGIEYQELLVKERAARALFRQRHPEAVREFRKQSKKVRPWKTHIVARARARARKIGLEATLRPSDIHWPTHCPVLGIELYYPTHVGRGDDSKRPDKPSLDRWDNTKGYIPGNVFVISFRANVLKSNATAAELMAVAKYATAGLGALQP